MHSRRETPIREREAECAARWAAGAWRGARLTTERGDCYQVVYEGRRGGGAGPDFRDAIVARDDGSRVCGDVELHLRASGWRAHGHERDSRYAHVVLHVVFHPLAPGMAPETLLSTGEAAPIAVLSPRPVEKGRFTGPPLPCARLVQRVPAHVLRQFLVGAGRARLLQRADRMMREIAVAAYDASDAEVCPIRWPAEERVLWANLAEALGYGRDRASLREGGERLAEGEAPDALRHAYPSLSRLDAIRLEGLLRLHTRWAETGAWGPLQDALVAGTARAAAKALPAMLHAAAPDISPGRARIIVANVALPFAVAVATLAGDAALRERALSVYDALPGLQSNAITRLMSRQFGMARLPAGTVAQQGLHHVWSAWCREKRCSCCPCSREGTADSAMLDTHPGAP